MPKKKSSSVHWLRRSLIRVAQLQLIFVVLYVAQIIAYDASKLITPEALMKRWIAAGSLALVAAIVWYLARSQVTTTRNYKLLTWALIVAGIAFAGFNVYTQRGMASRAVLLFVIPIAIATILHSRIALFTAAITSVIVYTTTAIMYFVNYFNEGYKIELYGEILFYSGVLFVITGLLWAALKSKRQ